MKTGGKKILREGSMSRLLILLLFLIVLILDYTSGVRDISYLRANVTSTLDNLLAINRYDKRLRPGFGGPPATISVNLAIKSMGPVSENEQSFGLDCYFRQQWYDLRLQFKKLPGLEEFSMSWLFLDKVWKPDTYFVNGKKSYLHRITVPNKFLRLRYDGFITYSMRLTLTASCPMYLRKFPLDAQRCPLVLGSYGYTDKDLTYQWTDPKGISLEPGVELAQFDLVNVTTEGEKIMTRGAFSYSTVSANFWLKRHTGYFMLQVYIPMGIIVTCSWISFWIDPDAVPARVTLGVTTVLSLTTMGFGGRAQLPKVSYWTALDWFVIICFTSVFSVMIEYAIVNFTDKITKDLKKIIEKRRKDAEISAKEKIKDSEKEVDQSEKIEKPILRIRSASFSVTSNLPEEPCRRISVGFLSKKSENIFDSKLSIPGLGVLKNIPRRLSATVRDFINLPELQSKLSRSILNLTSKTETQDEEKFETFSTIPKVVVSKLDGDDLIDLEAEIEPLEVGIDRLEEEEEEQEDEKSDGSEKETTCGTWKKMIKNPKELWEALKILPKEMDVIKLLEDPDPPDKFSKIDIQSRRSFPLAFFLSLMIYLFAFAYYLTDDFPERDTDLVLYKH